MGDGMGDEGVVEWPQNGAKNVVIFALEGTNLDNQVGDMRHKFVNSGKFTP
jgi:hypothetical protein